MLPWKCSSWTPIPPTSTEVNQFPWKLPPTFMEVNLVPSTSMEAAMEVATFSSLIYFHESFHRLPWKMEVGQLPYKQLQLPWNQQATSMCLSLFLWVGKQASFHEDRSSLGVGLELGLGLGLGVGQFCGSNCKFAVLVEVGGSMQGYMEAHGSFHGIDSWKLQLMEAMEASTSTDSGNFNVLP